MSSSDPSKSATDAQQHESVHVPIARARTSLHALIWLLAGAVVAAFGIQGLAGLNFEPQGRDNRAGTFALAALLIPVVLIGIVALIHGIRWLGLSLWPGAGVTVDERSLELRFGPFGNRKLDWSRLRARFFFEMDEDEHEGVFEAYLPEAQQRQKYLPRMHHPAMRRAVHLEMLRFLRRSEEDVAQRLNPVIEKWRTTDP